MGLLKIRTLYYINIEMAFTKSLSASAKRKNDIYMTPTELAQDIINIVPLVSGDLVLDPCRGEGAFYNNYPDYVDKDWCEITEQRDFYEYNEQVDWIITNPPFSKFTPWLQHTVKLCRKGFVYIGLPHSLSDLRVKIIKEAGFKLVYFQPCRIKSWFGYPIIIMMFSKEGDALDKLKWAY